MEQVILNSRQRARTRCPRGQLTFETRNLERVTAPLPANSILPAVYIQFVRDTVRYGRAGKLVVRAVFSQQNPPARTGRAFPRLRNLETGQRSITFTSQPPRPTFALSTAHRFRARRSCLASTISWMGVKSLCSLKTTGPCQSRSNRLPPTATRRRRTPAKARKFFDQHDQLSISCCPTLTGNQRYEFGKRPCVKNPSLNAVMVGLSGTHHRKGISPGSSFCRSVCSKLLG